MLVVQSDYSVKELLSGENLSGRHFHAVVLMDQDLQNPDLIAFLPTLASRMLKPRVADNRTVAQVTAQEALGSAIRMCVQSE